MLAMAALTDSDLSTFMEMTLWSTTIMNGVAENYVEGIQGVPLEWREFSAYSNPLRHCHLPWVIGRQRSPKGHLAFDDLYGAISSISLILLPAHTTCGR